MVLFFSNHGSAMHVVTHVVASGSTDSERLTTTSTRGHFASMCACTRPAVICSSAVCDERGG